MKKKSSIVVGSVCVSLSVLIGCKAPPPRPKPVTTLSCKVPTISPLPQTLEAQEKGGVEISVVPVSYKPVLEQEIRHRRIQPNFGESFQIEVQLATIPQAERHNYVFVEESTSVALRPSPDRLRFLVKINNHLSRVFRGAGTVVQFNVGGKLLAVDQQGYASMVEAIVPPRTEQQLEINGPALDVLPDKATIGLFLYDVVTAIDAAGNVIEKQNYEWYFDYTTRLVEKAVEMTLPVRKVIPIQSLRP
jgi:hypothetical protein